MWRLSDDDNSNNNNKAGENRSQRATYSPRSQHLVRDLRWRRVKSPPQITMNLPGGGSRSGKK